MEAALGARPEPLARQSRDIGRTPVTVTLSAPDMVCGACIRRVEAALRERPGVSAARANLAARRVVVAFDGQRTNVAALTQSLGNAGYAAAEINDAAAAPAVRSSDLIPRLGVAGFAAANIMLLSVSVWSGEVSDMDASVKELFHWLSAVIALPAIAYCGQPFFRSALSALRSGRLNMDVPISLGIILATAMSLFQTLRGTQQVYFDAAAMLVFFLLAGRALDERMRVRATGAAANLLSLKAVNATVVGEDGSTSLVASRDLSPGMHVLTAGGCRIPVDGVVVSGRSEVDEGLITGETSPRAVQTGDHVHAGTTNGFGALHIRITSTDDNTLLAEIGRMMLAAEQCRGRYVRLADRAARLYAPAVHVLSAVTFAGWMLLGAGWEQSLTHAIAVLIITCPCALALAVPAVQVAAIGRLFGHGVIVKAPDGLERLAEVDHVVFDKTGTLTLEHMALADAGAIDPHLLEQAAALAASSRHPYAQALAGAARAQGLAVRPREGVREEPGQGLVWSGNGAEERLGNAQWAGGKRCANTEAGLWFARNGGEPFGFVFRDRLRDDARSTVSVLRGAGYGVELLSGDRHCAVERAAHATGILRWRSAAKPNEKLARIAELQSTGRKTLMIGDGLNDAPALAAGHASMSPACAVDISQTAADAVFQGDRLEPVVETLKVARAARKMALQNFAIAILYNAAFVPLAMLGQVTPLVAALAMSTSSILVTANALRLRSMRLVLEPIRRTP